ncbi:hypothetical protein CPL00368_CDS0143 [Klebsiella phage DevonBitter]
MNSSHLSIQHSYPVTRYARSVIGRFFPHT